MMDPLLEAAIDARGKAHAPYSNYKVGAAVETEDGEVVPGCNVESSSFGLTVCAERVALGAAVARGHNSFKSMAIVSRDGATPCGACRQIIWDLCGNLPITLIDEDGKRETVMSGDLLPKPFDHRNLAAVDRPIEDPSGNS
ncbi:MAG: cytidine deaminase [Candidatus Neomarinimicrobiota bacterium]